MTNISFLKFIFVTLYGKYNKNMSKMPSLSNDKSLKSMKKHTISGLEQRFLRLGFTRYVVHDYGMNINTAYRKFRHGIVRRWELLGIRECICRYAGDDVENINDFYNNLEVKSNFVKFMEEEMGMSEHTVRKRFKAFDFSKLEIKGLSNVYNEFIGNIKGD